MKSSQDLLRLNLVFVLQGTWVVVKIRVPFWVPILTRHLLFRVPKKGLYF